MTTMTMIALPIPPSLQNYRDHLREFFAGMVRKLDMNSHKKTPEINDVDTILELLWGEIEEFKEAFDQDDVTNEALIELQDTANFAFLAYVAMRNDGVKTKREEIIDEFLEIDIVKGKVYCKKSRAGAQYKIGEEIKGTRRKGYIDIRLQTAAVVGRSLALPRSHIVWWKATGKWPVGVIDHINRARDDDRIENLRDISFSENNFNKDKVSKLPKYVTKYLPTGRSHLLHYGKYVYQRVYKGNNIRVAYFNSPEEASEQGPAEWARKVKEKTGDIVNV